MSWKLMLTLFSPFSSFLQKYTHFLNFTYKLKYVIYDAKVYKNWRRAGFMGEKKQ